MYVPKKSYILAVTTGITTGLWGNIYSKVLYKLSWSKKDEMQSEIEIWTFIF